MLRGCSVVFLAIRERREGEGLHVKKNLKKRNYARSKNNKIKSTLNVGVDKKYS